MILTAAHLEVNGIAAGMVGGASFTIVEPQVADQGVLDSPEKP
jgi:hypothetical protein